MEDSKIQQFEYDFCLSFAGEQREYVEEVASELTLAGASVFYDEYEKKSLWGKDLYSHLSEIYSRKSKYCILFASEAYAKNLWTSHERKNAQARALEQKGEYILPVTFDDTPIPGLPTMIGFINPSKTTPSELADLALQKLGKLRKIFLPQVLDRLYEYLDVENEDQSLVKSTAQSFFHVLRQMTADEREVVCGVLSCCCCEIQYGIHVEADNLSRYTNKSVDDLKRILSAIRPFGFDCSVEYTLHAHNGTRKDLKALESVKLFRLDWADRYSDSDVGEIPDHHVSWAMVSIAVDHYCEKCVRAALERLDFSYLSTLDASEDRHS